MVTQVNLQVFFDYTMLMILFSSQVSSNGDDYKPHYHTTRQNHIGYNPDIGVVDNSKSLNNHAQYH